MHLLLVVSAYLGAAAVIGASARRWLVRPLLHAVRELHAFRKQVRDADALSMQLAALAGSMTNLVVALLTVQDDHGNRIDDIAELLTDVSADLIRVQRDVKALKSSAA